MKITKLGHCCLLVEEQGLRILTDPGNWSTAQNDVMSIDVVLITHEHPDHLHVDSLKAVLKNNPNARVITNHGVAKILDTEGIRYELVTHGQNVNIGAVLIEGFGEKHADIYETITPVDNTGYFVGNRFFYPGDAYTNPGKAVEILALPVAGPWMKISEAMEYAKAIKPKFAFPVHDGGLKYLGPVHALPNRELPNHGIQFIIPEEGKVMEF